MKPVEFKKPGTSAKNVRRALFAQLLVLAACTFPFSAFADDEAEKLAFTARLFDLKKLYRDVPTQTKSNRVAAFDHQVQVGHDEPVIRFKDLVAQRDLLRKEYGSETDDLLIKLAMKTNDPVHWQIVLMLVKEPTEKIPVDVLDKTLLAEPFLSSKGRIVHNFYRRGWEDADIPSTLSFDELFRTTGRALLWNAMAIELANKRGPVSAILADPERMKVLHPQGQSFLNATDPETSENAYSRVLFDPQLRQVRSWLVRHDPESFWKMFRRYLRPEHTPTYEQRKPKQVEMWWTDKRTVATHQDLDVISLSKDIFAVERTEDQTASLRNFVGDVLEDSLASTPWNERKPKAHAILRSMSSDKISREVAISAIAKVLRSNYWDLANSDNRQEKRELNRTIMGIGRSLKPEEKKLFDEKLGRVAEIHQDYRSSREAAIKRQACYRNLLALIGR